MNRVQAGLTVLVTMATIYASAQDLDVIKAAMLARKATVDRLLVTQVVGENNGGFLEALKDVSAAAKEVVAAENDDRKVVYAAIAKKTGVTPEVVGRQRAAEIAVKVASGVMIQLPKGNWIAKPGGR